MPCYMVRLDLTREQAERLALAGGGDGSVEALEDFARGLVLSYLDRGEA